MALRRIPYLPVVLCWFQCVLRLPAIHGETGWPEGRVLAEKSASPDGHYGVLLPTRDQAGGEDEDKIANTLVDLKIHRALGVIRGSHYFSGQNHRDLAVVWAVNSSWCAVIYGARYGFGAITLVEPHGAKCTQFDAGQHVQQALDAAIARQNHGQAIGACASAFFRAGPGRLVLVRATGYTNPKGLSEQPTFSAFFEGTFDLATGKWTRSEAHKTASAKTDALNFAYSDYLDEGTTFDSEDSRLMWYDARLNEVYDSVRFVLPAERFAVVKKEQIAWLKEFATRTTNDAKRDFMAARIKELRRLVW